MSNIPSWIIFTLGFAAQFFFTARTLFQWLKSEKEKKVVAPSAYWVLSVIGAYLMFVYGVLRNDFSIILGQLISYTVYLWNLNAKGVWNKLHIIVKALLIGTPFVAVGLLLHDAPRWAQSFFHSEGLPMWLVLFGSAGQVIFTLRFVYQWAHSKIHGTSSLPLGFWIISIIGSATIIIYGIIRKDPVLILGQSFGFVAYIRNIIIGLRRGVQQERIVTSGDKDANP